MPLEDLIPLGYEVYRPPEPGPGHPTPPTGATVMGFDRQWYLQPGEDETSIVTEAMNHKKLYDKMTQAMTTFQDNYANWGSMTAQQKDAANRQAQRGLANLIRHVRGDLSSEGV